MRLVAGVLALNAAFAAAGYAWLLPALRARRAAAVASWGGLALLLGAGLTGVALQLLVLAGLPLRAPAVALALAAVLAAGVAVTRRLPAPALPASKPLGAPAGAAAGAIAAVLGLALVGGFRSSPWLDDTWFFWLPKGIVLREAGLEARLWEGGGGLWGLTSPDYPLWWSIVTALDVAVAGAELDLRAVNAQLALLLCAGVAALGRLLWGHARPSVLLPALLLLAASPELVRQAQGGGADVPLALYVMLGAVAACGWLALGEPAALVTVSALWATALAVKVEGLPQVLLLALVLAVVFRRERRRVALLGAGVAAAVSTWAPWALWRQAHDLGNEISLADATDLGYLLDRTERIRPSIVALLEHAFDPKQWLVVLPLALALAAAAATVRRAWLALPAVAVTLLGFWTWVYWADPNSVEYRVGTSSYRVVVPLLVLAAAALPLAAEDVLRARTASTARPRRPA